MRIAASVGGVTAILADSLFNYQFAVPPTYILLFTLLAIPALLGDVEVETESPGRPSPAPPARRHPWRLVLQVAGSMAILAAAGGLLWQQTRGLVSEHACTKPRRTSRTMMTWRLRKSPFGAVSVKMT